MRRLTALFAFAGQAGSAVALSAGKILKFAGRTVIETEDQFFGVPVSTVLEPAELTSCVVFNSPHSGKHYPDEFLNQTRLNRHQIRRSEDVAVDGLFSRCVEAGSPLHAANFPRAYVDANREPLELDPRMYDSALPKNANTNSSRVAGGLGSIPRIVSEGMDIYGHRLPVREALERIDAVHRPFHHTLRRLLIRSHQRYGRVVLIDCHSMPSSVRSGALSVAPDIVLGDRHGMSAARHISDTAVDFLRASGLVVARNKPYAGGFITEHYGRPLKGFHALQVEVNRALYMNEDTFELTSGFHLLRALFARFSLAMASAVTSYPEAGRLAAE